MARDTGLRAFFPRRCCGDTGHGQHLGESVMAQIGIHPRACKVTSHGNFYFISLMINDVSAPGPSTCLMHPTWAVLLTCRFCICRFDQLRTPCLGYFKIFICNIMSSAFYFFFLTNGPGFWMFSVHLPSKMDIWQEDSIDSPLQSFRMYQEKVRHHTGEIQDLRGHLNQLIAKLQEMEAMSDEQKMTQKIIKMIQGDYIEKPDFALKSIGASIDFEQTSATYNHDKACSYWNWIRLWNYAQPPDVILEPNVTPGNCWAFSGDRGQVTIRLAQKVYLSNLTLQHIPKTISLSGSLDTAPKDFVIYGVEGSPKEEVFLGAFQFQPENIIQTFQLQNQPPRTFGAVKVKISSNWGNPRFTCLYRVRVHGSVTLPREQPN
ncbi:hypothetical protein FD755_006235 [Muntiacus reevesi]|uniref:SUN domain-containing protein n=1 Tax=Muntiacus reevesi TaxID=9886 RepID=A0A5J5MVN3_MUNRE|nr:hypothetical protein FD755_006235 [Muntiacus reevesi]